METGHGFPSPAADCRDRPLDFNELLLKHRANTYCLRYKGPPISDGNIEDGDILVIDRALRPKDGDIVVAQVDGAFLTRRIRLRGSVGILCAKGGQDRDLLLGTENEVILFGVVSSLVRTFRP